MTWLIEQHNPLAHGEIALAQGVDDMGTTLTKLGVSQSDLARFEAGFHVTPGCWNWTKSVVTGGYGAFSIRAKSVRAHRFSYEAYVGPIPDGLLVLHGCDNRLCVNPDHLRVGTAADNAGDMSDRNRCASGPGERGPSHKLSEAQVRDILRDSRSQKVIAAAYGVNQSTVSMIKNRNLWSNLNVGAEDVAHEVKSTPWAYREGRVRDLLSHANSALSTTQMAVLINEEWCFRKTPNRFVITQVCRRIGAINTGGKYSLPSPP